MSKTKFSMQPQPEMLYIANRPNRFFIGIPREMTLQENRIALVPSSVAMLCAHGHRVLVEAGAGQKANFSDHDYSEAGAEIVQSKQEVFKASMLIKVAPPTLEEIDLLTPSQIIISPLQLPTISAEYLQKLKQKRVIALAMEYIKEQFTNTFPIVRMMSEIAGISSVLTAAELLSNTKGGEGILLGGIAGVPPSKVVVLGAGVVAEFATRTAIGLGAEVRIFDNNIYKIMRLQNQVGRQLHTSVFNLYHLQQELLTADVAIGAIHSKSGRAPMVVSEDMVRRMKQGSVIIDVSIDQGGCFETSQMTSHEHPTFEKYGVIHYCVPNIASRVARSASLAISNIITSILLRADATENMEGFLHDNLGLRHGIYMYKGCLTNAYLGERFQIKSTDLDLLITSEY